jgi:hypothetical protein
VTFYPIRDSSYAKAISALHPAHNSPNRRTIADSLLEKSYGNCKKKVDGILLDIELLNIITMKAAILTKPESTMSLFILILARCIGFLKRTTNGV